MPTCTKELVPELLAAQNQFESWRANNAKRKPIPIEMWDLAADLAKLHGIHSVSSALRLNYTRLKMQVNDNDEPSFGADNNFLEFSPSTFMAHTKEDYTIELASKQGHRMIIRSLSPVAVIKAITAFCQSTVK